MKFLIEPLDLWKDLSKLTDDDLLKRLSCGQGVGCCDGARQCGGGEEPDDEC